MKDIKFFPLLLAYSVVYGWLLWLNQHYVMTDNLYLNTIGDDNTVTQAKLLMEQQHRFGWITLVVQPFGMLARWLLVGGLLYCRLFLGDAEPRYTDTLKVVAFAELANIAAATFRTVALLFFVSQPDLQYVLDFAPLSLQSFFAPGALPVHYKPALQALNLFALAYFAALAWSLSSVFSLSWRRSINYVITGYGLAFLMWILLVTFLQINFN